MFAPRKKSFWYWLMIALALVFVQRPIHADDDVELALDPPDEPGAEAQLKDKAANEDRTTATEAQSAGDEAEIVGGKTTDDEAAETNPPDGEKPAPKPEAVVPQIDENTGEAQATGGTEQERLLRYHQQIIQDRERVATSTQEDPPHRFHLGVGAILPSQGNAGFDADFQVTLAKHFTIGAGGYTFTANLPANVYQGININASSVGSFGIIGDLNYYSRRPYEGIWVQLGMGIESLKQGTLSGPSVGTTTPIVLNVGWQWLELDHNLTFALAAGMRSYLFTGSPGVLFTGMAVVGLSWNVFPH